MKKRDRQVMERARLLWQDDGSPADKLDAYAERARELIANEENGKAARVPVQRTMAPAGARPYGEPVEPVEEAVRHQGEFPTLTDQGEEPLFPDDKESAGER